MDKPLVGGQAGNVTLHPAVAALLKSAQTAVAPQRVNNSELVTALEL